MAVKEKLQEYALLAEIIGGIAIVISLIFVGLEVRQSNNLNRANTYQSLMLGINELFTPIYNNTELSQLYGEYRAGRINELNIQERLRLRQILTSIFRIYDTAYYSYENSFIDEEQWIRFEFATCSQWNLADDDIKSIISNNSSDAFSSYIDSIC